MLATSGGKTIVFDYADFFSNRTGRKVAGIHVLVVARMQTLILNMNEYHWFLLKLLGEPYEKIYSGDG
jgi:hypothetical protein